MEGDEGSKMVVVQTGRASGPFCQCWLFTALRWDLQRTLVHMAAVWRRYGVGARWCRWTMEAAAP